MSDALARPRAKLARAQFAGVQATRALAAMMVVSLHAIEMWHIRIDPAHATEFWGAGAAGVDIFFVVSGFVMMVSSRHLAAVPGGWRVFAFRRFIRIAPFYWLVTTAKVASVAALPALALRTVLTPGGVAASYLFLPWRDAAGEIGPVLPVGWTLNMEAGFYVLFALALAIGVGPIPVVVPVLAAAAALSLLVTPQWPAVALYCDPVVLEFAAGLWLGRVALRGGTMPGPVAAAVAVAGLAAILFVPPQLPRILCWGVPAAMLVAGVVALERPLRAALPRWLLRLGDASYAIYLTHGFVLAVLGVLLARAGMGPGLSFATAVLAGGLLSAALGLACHQWVERPLLRWCRARLDPLP